MADNSALIQDIEKFWNDRAELGPEAGTADLIAKQLEMEAIASYVKDGLRVLEVGCGNGQTAFELARRYDINILGIDVASKMIEAANALLADQKLKGSIKFQVGNAPSLENITGKFDLIFSERVLINLPDWPAQKLAISNIINLLADNGLYVMCENSQDGLDEINSLRERLGLPAIKVPWHNRYFRDDEISQTQFPGAALEGVRYYSSTYYFLSRVVNAWLAAQEGKEPAYDAPINQLALRLPPLGNLGQGRIWLWRKIR